MTDPKRYSAERIERMAERHARDAAWYSDKGQEQSAHQSRLTSVMLRQAAQTEAKVMELVSVLTGIEVIANADRSHPAIAIMAREALSKFRGES